MRWLNSIMDMNLSKLREIVNDREAWCTAVNGIIESDMILQLNNNKLNSAYNQRPWKWIFCWSPLKGRQYADMLI